MDKRIEALIEFLDLEEEEKEGIEELLEEDYYGLSVFETWGNGKYAVAESWQEVKQAVDRCLDGYIDEVVLSQIPEQYSYYFDDELFKRDIWTGGDWEGIFSKIDGEVHEVKLENEDGFYYIVKIE